MKFLLIAISFIALLSFTSCEKDEMGDGGLGGGGGMQDKNTITRSTPAPKDKEDILVPKDTLKADK